MGVFSWPAVENSSWIARASWYCSLTLSIWALITSAQQGNLLRSLPKVSATDGFSTKDLDYIVEAILHRSKSQRMARHPSGAAKSLGLTHIVMLYVWQAPMMLMSYAWTTFLVALTVFMCKPWIKNGEPSDDDFKVCTAHPPIVFLSLTSLEIDLYGLSCCWGRRLPQFRRLFIFYLPEDLGPIPGCVNRERH